jgi:hypothetical protein
MPFPFPQNLVKFWHRQILTVRMGVSSFCENFAQFLYTFARKIERKYEGKNRRIPRQNTNYKLFELYSGWVSGKRRG